MTFFNRLLLQGTCDRLTYFTVGVIAFAIKFTIDRWIWASGTLSSRPFWPWSYFDPDLMQYFTRSPETFTLLLCTASIFVWIGVSHTVVRLRDARLPVGLAPLFFLPFVNLAFFALLCAIPAPIPEEDAQSRSWRRWLPQSDLGAAILAVILTGGALFLIGASAVSISRVYGGSVFVGVPFTAGFSGVLLAARNRPMSFARAQLIGLLTTMVIGVSFLLFAVEGLICILMTAPIALAFTLMGANIAFLVLRFHRGATLPLGLNCFGILALLVVVENKAAIIPPIYETTTILDIAASPDTVWHNVVEFSEISAPPEWIFRSGIAYPVRARIDGRGVGATRYCEFSTGSFVEPITVWNPPKELSFTVTSTPPPMQEWSPWHHIQPAHLEGYFLSKGGRFLLEPRPGGGTRVHATTWHQHRIWPAAYWRIFADFLIHRIHLRVLHHIATQSTL